MTSIDQGPASEPLAQAQRELEHLVKRYGERLFSQARIFVCADDAEDIVQEALLCYWERQVVAQPSDRSRNPLGLLMQFVHDLASSGWRRRRRRFTKVQKVGATLTQFLSPHRSSPLISGIRSWERADAWIDRSEVDPTLLDAIAKLPETQRVVFLYVHAQDLTYAQVGALLCKTETNVRKHCSLASIRLRQLLDARGYVPPVGFSAEPRRAARSTPPRRAAMELVVDDDGVDMSTQEAP